MPDDSDEIRNLRAERDAWRALAEGRSDLLVAYRTSRHPRESTHRKIEDALDRLRSLGVVGVKP